MSLSGSLPSLQGMNSYPFILSTVCVHTIPGLLLLTTSSATYQALLASVKVVVLFWSSLAVCFVLCTFQAPLNVLSSIPGNH